MKDDEEFWDAVDEEEENQSEGRVALYPTSGGDEHSSMEEMLPAARTTHTAAGSHLSPSLGNKKPLSTQRKQSNGSGGGDIPSTKRQAYNCVDGSKYDCITSSVPETELPGDVSHVINEPGDDSSRAGVQDVKNSIGKLELSSTGLSPISKVDTPPGGQRPGKPSTLEDGQQPIEIKLLQTEEDDMSPHFMVVNQDTGEKFHVKDIDKHSPNNHNSSIATKEQPRHNWRKARSGGGCGGDEQQFIAQDENPGEKKESRWRKGRNQKKSPGHEQHKHCLSATSDGYVRRSGGRKDGFFGNFLLLQELGNVNETDDTTADVESKDASTKRGHSGPIWALEFSHDGQFVAWGGEDGCVVVARILGFMENNGKEVSSKSNESYNTNDPTCPTLRRVLLPSSDDTASDLVSGLLDKDPLHVFEGHTSDVICLAWSASSFLLSSSKDMTVRLWHVTQPQCLHIFQHSEIVTSVHFHPTHEHFFLTGCFDKKVRIWNIKNGRVQEWQQAQDMITSARFSNDGAMVIVGLYRGQVLFYQTEGMRYFTQIECRNRRGTYRSGRMVTGLEFRLASRPPGTVGGAVVHGVPSPLEVLVTTNDSRLRLYQTDDFSMIAKFKGLVNEDNYLIRASFSEDGKYIVSGSESGKVVLWAVESTCVSTASSTHRNTAKPLDSFYAASDDSAIVIVSRFLPESSVLACVRNVRGRIDRKLHASGSYRNSMLATTDSSGIVRIYARQDIFCV